MCLEDTGRVNTSKRTQLTQLFFVYHDTNHHIQSSENNRIRVIFTLCTFGASGLGHDEPVPVAALLVVVAHAQVVPNLVGHHVDRREARRRVGFTLKQPVVNCNTRC